MLSTSLTRFEKILAEAPGRLLQFSEDNATAKVRPGKWSKKEVMGHLIDSAANNHQRFVRLQCTSKPLELWTYEQNEWVKLQHYNNREWKDIVQLWHLYNVHLLHIMRQVKTGSLHNMGIFPGGKEQSLLFIMTDYVCHLEHHLKQTGISL